MVPNFLKSIPFRKLPKSITKNWQIKLLSLIIGMNAWYFVAGEAQVDMSIVVPIEIVNLPANLVISNQYKRDIEVSVRGPERMIQNLRARNISRQVDLSEATPGSMVLDNDARSINLPQGITVQRLQPTSITLLLDELIEKKFPINPVTKGDVTAGYQLQGVSLQPNELSITGPRSVLQSTSALSTYVIELDGLDHSTTLQVNLNLSPAFVRLIGETVVTADIKLQERMVEQTIRNIPVNVRSATISATTEPGSISVTASIPANLIRDTPEPTMLFRAFVDAGNLNRAEKLPVTVNAINVPEHEAIKIISIRPETVMTIPVEKLNGQQ